MYTIQYFKTLVTVVDELTGMLAECPELQLFIDGIKHADRGILR